MLHIVLYSAHQAHKTRAYFCEKQILDNIKQILFLISIFCRTDSVHFLKRTIEVGHIVEARLKADLRDGEIAFTQELASKAHAILIEVGDEGLTSGAFEKHAERRTVHAHMPVSAWDLRGSSCLSQACRTYAT